MNTGRKITGGKYHKHRKKKLYEKINQERKVVLGGKRIKKFRVRSGRIKTVLLKENTANLLTKNGMKRVEIKNVLETPQNSFLARQNRLMKGAMIETSAGKARITNRPGQEGHINAVLIDE